MPRSRSPKRQQVSPGLQYATNLLPCRRRWNCSVPFLPEQTQTKWCVDEALVIEVVGFGPQNGGHVARCQKYLCLLCHCYVSLALTKPSTLLRQSTKRNWVLPLVLLPS